MSTHDAFPRRFSCSRSVLVSIVGGAALVAGCSVRAGAIPGVVGVEARLPAMVLATGVEGCDCTTAVLLPAPAPSLGRAVEAALASVDEAVVLIDASVETSSLWSGIYNRRCACVRGSAAKLARQVVLSSPPGHHSADGDHGPH